MELADILAISGQPGLYKYVARSNNGVIVESLLDGRRINASGTSRVSAMTDIAIFTENEDLPLADVFTSLYKISDGKKTISHKDPADKIVAVFSEAVPTYDRSRVHMSDMKKIISWYNILIDCGMTEFKVPEDNDSSSIIKTPEQQQ